MLLQSFLMYCVHTSLNSCPIYCTCTPKHLYIGLEKQLNKELHYPIDLISLYIFVLQRLEELTYSIFSSMSKTERVSVWSHTCLLLVVRIGIRVRAWEYLVQTNSTSHLHTDICCWHCSGWMVEYAHQVCWISNTYYLPPNEAPLTKDQPRERVLIYYQVLVNQ